MSPKKKKMKKKKRSGRRQPSSAGWAGDKEQSTGRRGAGDDVNRLRGRAVMGRVARCCRWLRWAVRLCQQRVPNRWLSVVLSPAPAHSHPYAHASTCASTNDDRRRAAPRWRRPSPGRFSFYRCVLLSPSTSSSSLFVVLRPGRARTMSAMNRLFSNVQ